MKTTGKTIKANDVLQGSGDVFADLGLPNAEQELTKARLALQIARIIKDCGLTQVEAAKILGIQQPRVSALTRNRAGNFSIGRSEEGCPTQASLVWATHLPAKLKVAGIAQSQSKSAVSEGIEDRNREVSKIAFVARGDGEPMNARSARNHGIFDQRIGLPIDQAGVFAKASRIHRQNLRSPFQSRRPYLDLVCFRRIRPSRPFHAPLNFAESDR